MDGTVERPAESVEHVIYQFWTDSNPMTDNRKRALQSILRSTDIPRRFLDRDGIESHLVEGHPLHPGYRFLTSIQKVDYLKFYFMHHYGGGYADIKHFSPDNNWSECFSLMDAHPEIDVVGMHEVPDGSPISEYNTPACLDIVLSNGFFIFRPHSKVSTMCYNRLIEVMDANYAELERHPAQGAYQGGEGYPLSWYAIMGEIFHPVLMDVHGKEPWRISNALRPGWIMGLWHR